LVNGELIECSLAIWRVSTDIPSLEQHCHIAWHIGEGLGMQYVEAPDQIVFPNKEAFAQQCNNYKAYAANKGEDPYGVYDSGL
jgi:hypothetical protein